VKLVSRSGDLAKQAVKEYDVGVTFAHGGENELVVRGPGDPPSDERPPISEIRDRMHFAVRG
jgi:hypothetical protein